MHAQKFNRKRFGIILTIIFSITLYALLEASTNGQRYPRNNGKLSILLADSYFIWRFPAHPFLQYALSSLDETMRDWLSSILFFPGLLFNVGLYSYTVETLIRVIIARR